MGILLSAESSELVRAGPSPDPDVGIMGSFLGSATGTLSRSSRWLSKARCITLNGTLSPRMLALVAPAACMSRFHFSRVFSSTVGGDA